MFTPLYFLKQYLNFATKGILFRGSGYKVFLMPTVVTDRANNLGVIINNDRQERFIINLVTSLKKEYSVLKRITMISKLLLSISAFQQTIPMFVFEPKQK